MAATDDPARYAHHSPYTDPGPYADRLAAVPAEPEALATVARNVIVHYQGHADELPAATRSDVHLRWLAATLATDEERHDARPLAAPRALPERVQGCCRDHTLFCVGALRQHGVPARSRIGYAGYLEPEYHRDHVIVEVHAGDRWVRFDPEIAEPDTDLPTPYDIPAGPGSPFVTAAEVWLGYRAGTLDPDAYGVGRGLGVEGPWMVQNYVLRELAHRQRDELLLWDFWGAMVPPGVPDPEVAAFTDEIAALLVRADAGDPAAEAELAERYAADERLHPSATVDRFSPFGPEAVTERIGAWPGPPR